MRRPVILLVAVSILFPLVGAVQAQPGAASGSRASWLLTRTEMDVRGLDFAGFRQTEIGGSRAPAEAGEHHAPRGLPILLSLILPGAGEVSMGYKRGFILMAADIASWIGVKHYHDLGGDKRDEYMAYAEQHWSEAKLAGAFDPFYEDEYIAGVGQEYFPDVSTYTELPLWVSRDVDEREYFENLGKWDQFIFGWDDFRRAEDIPGYTPTGTIQDLKQPAASYHREAYRAMRIDSNDQFTKRDRLLYLNIGLRVLSVLQVAYLQGVFGGRPQQSLQIAGHPVQLIAESHGLDASRVGLALAY
jgi:hypothetical protein